jgi:hypothetical protein
MTIDDATPPPPPSSLSKPGAPQPAAVWEPRAFLKIWLDVMSQSMDEYLRSTFFLESMQRNLQSLTQPWTFGSPSPVSLKRATESDPLP